jgi:cobyrinic acid a,c-diamide synthase
VSPSAACPRLLIGGTSSGVGKTTFSVGLTRALIRRGLSVAVFKCGPDYLDPSYHRRASGRPVHNLDSWLMGEDALRATFVRNAAPVDVSFIEGVMGLFDGASPTDLRASSAEVAQLLAAPIALVCDASGMARSIAALAHGFASFEPNVRLHGLICNFVGSSGHLELLRRSQPVLPVLGGMLRDPLAAFPERHLGLHAAEELDLSQAIEAWADQVEQHCDVPALLALARAAPALPLPQPSAADATLAPVRIAVALDQAFSFYYDENLRLLEQAGAQLQFFSPLRDASPPEADGLYIGGGYPELHAAQLSANHAMLAGLRDFAAAGKPVYAECGGLMYLSDAIVTSDGTSHPMLGLVPGRARMSQRLRALGYVEVETQTDTFLGPTGTRFRGHQFRYSQFETSVAAQRYEVRAVRSGQCEPEGYGSAHVLASYVHAHWASNPAIPAAFVAHCRARNR